MEETFPCCLGGNFQLVGVYSAMRYRNVSIHKCNRTAYLRKRKCDTEPGGWSHLSRSLMSAKACAS